MFGICWHKWGKWSEPEMVSVNVLFPLYGTSERAIRFRQQRICEKCGKLQVRFTS